jgi:hypothetical protein
MVILTAPKWKYLKGQEEKQTAFVGGRRIQSLETGTVGIGPSDAIDPVKSLGSNRQGQQGMGAPVRGVDLCGLGATLYRLSRLNWRG